MRRRRAGAEKSSVYIGGDREVLARSRFTAQVLVRGIKKYLNSGGKIK